MPDRLSLRLQQLQHEVHEPPQIIECARLENPFPAGLVRQLRVTISSDLDESNNLVVAEPRHRGVNAALVEAQPVIMWLTVRPDTKAITIDTDSGPFLEPCTHLHPRPDPCDGLGLKIEGEESHAHRTAAQITVPV